MIHRRVELDGGIERGPDERGEHRGRRESAQDCRSGRAAKAPKCVAPGSPAEEVAGEQQNDDRGAVQRSHEAQQEERGPDRSEPDPGRHRERLRHGSNGEPPEDPPPQGIGGRTHERGDKEMNEDEASERHAIHWARQSLSASKLSALRDGRREVVREFRSSRPRCRARASRTLTRPRIAASGAGPPIPQGLRIKSFVEGDELVAEWRPQPHHVAFEGIVNGGICGALLDCHSNWAAAHHLMKQSGESTPPCTVTADFHVVLKRPDSLRRAPASEGESRRGEGGSGGRRGDARSERQGHGHLPRHLRGGQAGASGVPPLGRRSTSAPLDTVPLQDLRHSPFAPRSSLGFSLPHRKGDASMRPAFSCRTAAGAAARVALRGPAARRHDASKRPTSTATSGRGCRR